MSALGPEARSILKAGRAGDDPQPADRARLRRKIGRAIAAGAAGAASAAGTAAGGAAAAAAGKGLSGALLANVLGGVLLGGAVCAGVWLASSPPPRPAAPVTSHAVGDSTSAEAASLPAPIAPRAPAPEPPAPSAEPSSEPFAATAPPPVLPAQRPPASAAAPAPRGTDDPLVRETRSLGEAHGALQSGDPERALKLLDEQSATYADGQLREERAATRVRVLCKLGRTDEARAEAAAFLRDNPRSPLADRVRGACPAAPAP